MTVFAYFQPVVVVFIGFTTGDFESLAVIGKGAFGEVRGKAIKQSLREILKNFAYLAGASCTTKENWGNFGHEVNDQRRHGPQEAGLY